jgi:hypothetical protein
MNEATVRAYVEAFNCFDMPRPRALFAPDAHIYGVLGHGGLDDVEPIWSELHHGMNTHLHIAGIVSRNGEVVLRLHETGRFTGPFRGLAGHSPTGRGYEITAMEWFALADGRITNRWAARDSAAIARQVLG